MDRVPHELAIRLTAPVAPYPGRWFPLLDALLQARQLGLTGLAANRMDGSVQVLTEVDREAVDSLLEWLQSRDARAAWPTWIPLSSLPPVSLRPASAPREVALATLRRYRLSDQQGQDLRRRELSGEVRALVDFLVI